MREFRTGSSRVLITTDLLARGIGTYLKEFSLDTSVFIVSKLFNNPPSIDFEFLFRCPTSFVGYQL